MPSVAAQRIQVPVGNSIPALLPHAISVSLPTWEDNVAYEEGEPWIVAAMQTGYPRFFIHKSIQKVNPYILSFGGSYKGIKKESKRTKGRKGRRDDDST